MIRKPVVFGSYKIFHLQNFAISNGRNFLSRKSVVHEPELSKTKDRRLEKGKKKKWEENYISICSVAQATKYSALLYYT